MRHICQLLLQAAFISTIAFYGCTVYQKPRPFHDVPFQERSRSKVDGEVRVTVVVLSDEESRQLFGVDLAIQEMQSVWVRVQNADSSPYWLMSAGLDPDYFSPLESAYVFHTILSGSLNDKMDDQFRVMGFRNPIAPGASVSGFFFVNRDEGIKVVDIDLISYGKTKFFTFFVPVPGIRADYHDVDFEKLYSEEDIVNLDEDDLRSALEKLPCCATNKDGTKNGDPLNLVLIGSREDISAAFVRRGWLPAEETHGTAVWKTIKSFLFGSRYRYSPVSPLYLYGRDQDFAGDVPVSWTGQGKVVLRIRKNNKETNLNPARILTVCMTAMLVAGSARSPPIRRPTRGRPCCRSTRCPTAPRSTANWPNGPGCHPSRRNGSTSAPSIRIPTRRSGRCRTISRPARRCGMKPGSPDLYFLIVVRDSQRYTEPKAAWVEGDRVELFLDFGRQARDEQQPDWWKDKDRNRFANPPGMGQFGLGPQTLAFAAELRVASGAAKWKYDYASVPVEGGTAYELRVDGQSVLDVRRQGPARTRRLRADPRRPGQPAGAAHRGLEQRRPSRRR